MPDEFQTDKAAVRSHWEQEPCGTRYSDLEDRRAFFNEVERERYSLEPYIRDFANFPSARGLRVLEIGVGAGTDYVNWLREGAIATGVDLTDAGIALTRERVALEGLKANLLRADAENLPFPDASFDLVYSYGVLHHTPGTPQAVNEVHRVLRPGGSARIMIYHHPSWVGAMLWAIHCMARLRPWHGMKWAVYHHLESPGTKTYTQSEGRKLFERFSSVSTRTHLGPGDLLTIRPSAKYGSLLSKALWRAYPRGLVRRLGHRLGLGLLIEASK